MHKHVLVVLAHPDDETYGCAGTIALHTRAGTPVTYVCATLGEMGRNMGRPIFATRESLPVLREKELREACRVMGIQDLRLLGYRDKTVEFVDPAELQARISTIITELQPSQVITFYPDHAVHPDHNAVGAATIAAIAALPPEERPEVHCKAFGPTIDQLGPYEVVDVSSVLPVKLAAFQAHRSQTEVMFSRIEAEAAKDPERRRQLEKERSQERYWIYRF